MSSPTNGDIPLSGDDSDDDMDWEEVVPSTSILSLPDNNPLNSLNENVLEIDVPPVSEARPIEITIRGNNQPPAKDPQAQYVHDFLA